MAQYLDKAMIYLSLINVMLMLVGVIWVRVMSVHIHLGQLRRINY
jgi:hypothetical protein